MKIVCDACQSPYSISDKEIPAGGFKFQCKKCHEIIVADASGGPSSPPSVARLMAYLVAGGLAGTVVAMALQYAEGTSVAWLTTQQWVRGAKLLGYAPTVAGFVLSTVTCVAVYFALKYLATALGAYRSSKDSVGSLGGVVSGLVATVATVAACFAYFGATRRFDIVPDVGVGTAGFILVCWFSAFGPIGGAPQRATNLIGTLLDVLSS